MPVDVAVEEPWARVVGKESNGYEVSMAGPNAHDIADDRVIEVVRFTPGAPNHMEGMLVRNISARECGDRSICMDLRRAGELDANNVRGLSMSKSEQNRDYSYRSGNNKGRNRELNTLVSLESIDAARWKEIRRLLCTAQYLEQHRDRGRLEGHPIDGEPFIPLIN